MDSSTAPYAPSGPRSPCGRRSMSAEEPFRHWERGILITRPSRPRRPRNSRPPQPLTTAHGEQTKLNVQTPFRLPALSENRIHSPIPHRAESRLPVEENRIPPSEDLIRTRAESRRDAPGNSGGRESAYGVPGEVE